MITPRWARAIFSAWLLSTDSGEQISTVMIGDWKMNEKLNWHFRKLCIVLLVVTMAVIYGAEVGS